MSNFNDILSSNVEEDVQRFLTGHQDILTETFGKMVCLPKFRFGNTFISDFVLLGVSSLGYHIDLVELEPPTQRAFTAKGRYAKRLNDAIGQINDWFAWISENKDYFIRTLCDEAGDEALAYLLSRRYEGSWPVYIEGKIVIGRRETLSEADNKRRRAIYLSTNRTIEITHYDRLLDTHERRVEFQMISGNNVSQDVFARLASSRFPGVRQRVASQLRGNETTLKKLARDPVAEVVSAVAKNEHAGEVVFRLLADRGDRTILRELARNQAIGGEILASIFEIKDVYTRELVLQHVNCPEHILVAAVGSANQSLKTLALENPNLADESILRTLATDPSFSVRIRVARNPHVPTDILSQLANDPHRQVRLAARYENSTSSEEILLRGIIEEWDNPWAKRKIARHPNLTQSAALAELANDEHYLVRMAVAENPNLPPNIRDRLLHDPDSRVTTAASKVTKSRPDAV